MSTIEKLKKVTSTELGLEELDIELKKKQIKKLEHEVSQLENRWPRILDVTQKLVTPFLVMGTGIFVYFTDVPKLYKEAASLKSDVSSYKASIATLKQQEEDAKTKERSAQAAAELASAKANAAEVKANLAAADAFQADLSIKADNDQKAKSSAFSKHVFIQFKGEVQREVINQLRARLTASGFPAPPAERLSSVAGNEIRYFVDSPDERKRADQTAQIIKEFFRENKCPLDINVKLVKLPSGKPAPLEAWLYPICK